MALISALFIDFDNVYSALRDDNANVAARFVNRPLNWLQALETHLELPDGGDGSVRRIVSRRCYASPQQINLYRRNFTHTGFEVIDCPPLTTHMKNSADIYMVMDIVDYLTRYPQIEEFIILSADADFVPVLNRLRREMKRSAIFTAANTSSAYRNCADLTVDAEFFATHLEATIERGTSPAFPAAPPLRPTAALDPDLAERVRLCLHEAVARRSGRLPFASAAQAVINALAARLGNDWAGQRTFTALLAGVTLPELEIDWQAQEIRGEVTLTLPGWPDSDREALVDFVADVVNAATKSIPTWPPAAYRLVFDEFAAYYRGDPQTFSDGVNAVVAACAAQGFVVTAQEVRFVGTGISIQGYRYDKDADPAILAALWRLQLFELCNAPDWMRDEEDAALLAAWCRAESESVEDARDDFIARTADEIVEPPVSSDGDAD